ncbi:Spc97/Spc98 [Anaeromyces robustus]|uniref:Spindle pole body component n=1 Tax=Anaeromyces robustus TaxID=1754192 RepID=A0A1Y1XA35_9FUNG|nr:Spc97/Spc98 [Anaeromyces robustus]|eukprot:ORX82598.1 Spc97/Spc98 [Anaeromyces robustus]
MLHELLLALSGHYGEVFTLHPPPPQQSETFKIPVNFPIYLHISEREALEELAHLGFLYLQISNFVKEKLEYTDKYNVKTIPKLEDEPMTYPSLDNISPLIGENRNTAKSKPLEYSLQDYKNGYYIRALCSGINQILDKYLDRIAMAERKILDSLDPETIGPSTPISFLKYYFSEYKVILPYIYQLTINIKDAPHKYHGTLLLSKLYNCANNGIPEIKKTFLFLFKVCNFVFYKQLISWVIYGKLEDRYNEFFIRLNENKKRNIGKNTYSRINIPTWYSEYELIDDYIPIYIKKDIAKTILFIGKSVAAIYDPRNQKKRLSNFSLQSQLNELSKLSQYNSFNNYKFETVIRNIKHIVSNALWRVVVIDENLLLYLEVFRNYFLLVKGDYFVKFIEECETLKARANIRSALITEQDLNNLWNRIAINTTAENDETLENFSFKVYHKASELEDYIYRSPYDDYLFGFPIRLEYFIKWPLDLIFTQSDFDKYNTLFSFLIVLKRVQIRLQQLLTRTYTNRYTRHQRFEHQNHIWSIRQMMLFFINCLWSYIQVKEFINNLN